MKEKIIGTALIAAGTIGLAVIAKVALEENILLRRKIEIRDQQIELILDTKKKQLTTAVMLMPSESVIEFAAQVLNPEDFLDWGASILQTRK